MTFDDVSKQQLTLNVVLDAIHNDILLTDTQCKINYMNLKAKSNLFNDIANLQDDMGEVMTSFCEKYQPDKGQLLLEIVKRTADPESFVAENLVIHIKRSTIKAYEVTTSPIYDSNVGHIGRLWQFVDVTLSERFNEMKSEFISLASHQLRTPLTSIRGYVDMLINGDYGAVPQELTEPLRFVQHAGTEMADLINDLLNVGRLEKPGALKLSTVSLGELIDELKAMFEQKLEQKKLSFSYVSNVAAITISTDRDKIREALKNLIDNAIKYNREEGRVAVSASIDDKNLRIEISDSGIGIPVDQQDRIFEKFFRAANVLTENFDGTGLGLYYVKEVVTKLGGQVDFKSTPNEGSTFIITLPLKIEQ